MGLSAETRLRARFMLYSADLASCVPGLHGQFGCPACLQVFRIPPGVLLRDVLAEEHIVSGALGGRLTTLTCRRCNNSAGSTLERHLVQRVLVENGKRPIPVRVTIGEAVHRSELHVPVDLTGGEPIRIVGIPKQSDPRQVEIAKQAMLSGAKTIKLRGSFGYVHRRTVVALIRSAYLLMFRVFGYRYVLDVGARPLREQLQDPLAEAPILNSTMWRIPDVTITESCVAIVSEPQELRSFLVLLKLNDEPCHMAGVFMPPPRFDGAAFYERLASREAPAELSFRALPMVSGFLPYRYTWEHLLKGPRSR